MRSSVVFYLNGKRHELNGDEALSPLTDYLRYKESLTGTKVVCAEGDCGACTVLLSRFVDGKFADFTPINSCITTPAFLDGSHLVTVEGLSHGDDLHPVQDAMMQHHGAQCGFCTPGIVSALAGLFEKKTKCSEQQTRNALTGNLCRCTGYEPILKAAGAVKKDVRGDLSSRYLNDEMINRELAALADEDLFIETPERSYFAPVKLKSLLSYKKDHPEVRVVSAATDIGVAANKKSGWRQKFLSLARIADCAKLQESTEDITIGANVTLSNLQAFVETSHAEFHNLLNIFASPQIRNVATLVGNIANASPIADTLPFLFVMNAEIEIQSQDKIRKVNINDFYLGYKKLDLQPDEIITAVHLPKLKTDEHLKLYKVSRRKDLDIACVTYGALMKMNGTVCTSARVALGGVGPVVLRLPRTETFLQGKVPDLSVLTKAGELAQMEVSPMTDVRGTKEYRLSLVKNLFLKSFY